MWAWLTRFAFVRWLLGGEWTYDPMADLGTVSRRWIDEHVRGDR